MEGSSLEFLKYQENVAGFYAPRHNHACYELVYYITGSGRSTLGDAHFTYAPNSFVLIPPQLQHDELAQTDSHLLFIGFCHDGAPPLLPGLYRDFNNGVVYQLLCRMQQELADQHSYHALLLNNLTQQLVLLIAREFFGGDVSQDDCNVSYVQRYIEEHFSEHLSSRELAGMSGYSYDWFRHMFKEKTGCSLAQYIIRQKLRHASTLLITTELPVTAIALQCQFSSASQFIALFKRQYGATPREYRIHSLDKQTVELTNT